MVVGKEVSRVMKGDWAEWSCHFRQGSQERDVSDLTILALWLLLDSISEVSEDMSAFWSRPLRFQMQQRTDTGDTDPL